MTIRDDLLQVLARRALTEDAARPEAVARLHARGGRTAREHVASVVDPGSLVEYGRFATAAQEDRRSLDELLDRTAADGLVGGVATIGGRPCAVLSYDYLVMAGTQGIRGHQKTDRLLDVIDRLQLPTVFFAAGGGVARGTPPCPSCPRWTSRRSRGGPVCPGGCRGSPWSTATASQGTP